MDASPYGHAALEKGGATGCSALIPRLSQCRTRPSSAETLWKDHQKCSGLRIRRLVNPVTGLWTHDSSHIGRLLGLTASQSLVAQNDEFWPAMNSYKSMADYSRFYF